MVISNPQGRVQVCSPVPGDIQLDILATIRIKDPQTAAASLTRDAVQSFLQRSRLVQRFGSRVPPSPVESKVRETIHSWNLGVLEDILEKSIANGLGIGFMSYQHASYELQVVISLFTACNFLFDDCVVPPEALQQFGRRFYRQLPQLHPVLDKFIEMAVALGDYYPLYSADMICAGTLQYGSEEILLSERSDLSTLQPGATEYIEYSRLKGGIPEPFAYCAWPSSICPDVNEYISSYSRSLGIHQLYLRCLFLL
ncbi:unnamed protein product [Somion occarium]|uniref:Uncharacterized protein n=1 Tax=Somion occarium TaxID=3059160 RepID=A0ABP1D416_9APHY